MESDLMLYERDAHVWQTVNFWSDIGSSNWREAMKTYAAMELHGGSRD